MYKTQGVTCHDNDECAEFAVCDGASAKCPLTPKADNVSCHCKDNNCSANPDTNPQFCLDGICDDFICELYNAEQCGLPHPHACQLGCVGPGFGDGQTCISTFETSETPAGIGQGRYLYPGTACMNNRGMCDGKGGCNYISPDDMEHADAWMDRINKYWEEIVITFAVVLFLLVLFVQHRYLKRVKSQRAASERAYLLAAANEEYERSEDNRAFGDSYGLLDVSVRPVLAGGNDEYSVPITPPRNSEC